MGYSDTGMILLYVLLAVGIVLIAGLFGFLVWILIKYRKKRHKGRLVTVGVALLAAASWVINVGWFRVILTWVPIPLVYFVFFVVVSILSQGYIDRSARLKTYTVISHILFLLSYFLFPDFGDVGEPYVFFLLIRHSSVSALILPAIACSIVCIVLLILQIAAIGRIKKAAAQASVSGE